MKNKHLLWHNYNSVTMWVLELYFNLYISYFTLFRALSIRTPSHLSAWILLHYLVFFSSPQSHLTRTNLIYCCCWVKTHSSLHSLCCYCSAFNLCQLNSETLLIVYNYKTLTLTCSHPRQLLHKKCQKVQRQFSKESPDTQCFFSFYCG